MVLEDLWTFWNSHDSAAQRANEETKWIFIKIKRPAIYLFIDEYAQLAPRLDTSLPVICLLYVYPLCLLLLQSGRCYFMRRRRIESIHQQFLFVGKNTSSWSINRIRIRYFKDIGANWGNVCLLRALIEFSLLSFHLVHLQAADRWRSNQVAEVCAKLLHLPVAVVRFRSWCAFRGIRNNR